MDVVTNYNISYTRISGCSDAPSDFIVVSGSRRTLKLVNLEETITYEINITALNIHGNLATVTNATTLEAGKSNKNYTPC